jgi:hypothetical protein
MRNREAFYPHVDTMKVDARWAPKDLTGVLMGIVCAGGTDSRCSDRLVFLVRERKFAKVREERVQAFKRDGSWGCDLDTDGTAAASVVDDQ